MIAFFGFSPVVQRIEWEFPKLLIWVRFPAELREESLQQCKLFFVLQNQNFRPVIFFKSINNKNVYIWN